MARDWLSGGDATPWRSLDYERRLALFDEFQPQRNVVFVGDSHVQLAEWGDMFPDAVVANRGINGDTTAGVLRRLAQIVALKPAVVVLMVGVNDFRALNANPEEVAARYLQIIAGIPTSARVVALAVLETAELDAAAVNPKVVALNALIRGMCGARCTFLDLNPTLAPEGRLRADLSGDGLHLNARGYRLVAEGLAPLIAAEGVQ